jgi:hypothetical protein
MPREEVYFHVSLWLFGRIIFGLHFPHTEGSGTPANRVWGCLIPDLGSELLDRQLMFKSYHLVDVVRLAILINHRVEVSLLTVHLPAIESTPRLDHFALYIALRRIGLRLLLRLRLFRNGLVFWYVNPTIRFLFHQLFFLNFVIRLRQKCVVNKSFNLVYNRLFNRTNFRFFYF